MKKVEIVEEKELGEVEVEKQVEERGINKEKWTKVKYSNLANKTVEAVKQTEITLDSDYIMLMKNKQNLHKRTGPQCAPIIQSAGNVDVNLETHI